MGPSAEGGVEEEEGAGTQLLLEQMWRSTGAEGGGADVSIDGGGEDGPINAGGDEGGNSIMLISKVF